MFALEFLRGGGGGRGRKRSVEVGPQGGEEE